MCIYYKSPIIYSEVLFPGALDLDLSEFLLEGCSTWVEIVVDVFDVDNYKFTESFSAQSGFEFVFPIVGLVNFKGLHGLDVYNMNWFRDFVNENHWADTSVEITDSFWENHQIISANGSQFHNKSVLKMIISWLFIVRHQLFRMFIPANHMITDELHESGGVRSMFKLEVKTVTTVFRFQSNTLFLCIMLQNQLF